MSRCEAAICLHEITIHFSEEVSPERVDAKSEVLKSTEDSQTRLAKSRMLKPALSCGGQGWGTPPQVTSC